MQRQINLTVSKSMTRWPTLYVEGNIGSGKSSLLDYVNNNNDVRVLKEPVDVWSNFHGHNILEGMYKDGDLYRSAFQSLATVTMLENHKVQNNGKIKLMERSVFSSWEIFAKLQLEKGLLKVYDYEILRKWKDMVITDECFNTVNDGFLYLKTSPEVALGRLKARGRHEESEVQESYIREIHERHEEWISNLDKTMTSALIVVNADSNKDEIHAKVSSFISELEKGRTLKPFERISL